MKIKKEDISYDISDMYILARQVQRWLCIICDKNCGLEPARFDPA